jgi:hypothetical protein
MKLTEQLLNEVFSQTIDKVVGTSHSGRMIAKLEQIGCNITESRYRRLRSFYKQMNRGIDLSK